MAKFLVIILLATLSLSALAAPFQDEDYQVEQEVDDHLRFRRVTCDLLSVGGYLGDSACAANCLSTGKAGGRCNGGVCQCRKTKIKDLWDKRFG